MPPSYASAHDTHSPRLSVQAEDILVRAAEGGVSEIRRRSTGERLGALTLSADATASVTLFEGRGGFCAIVSSPKHLRYIGLPGSDIGVGGVRLSLSGLFINPAFVSAPVRSATVPKRQTLTPQAMILGAGMATRFEPVSGDFTGYSKPAAPLIGEKSVIRLIAEHLAAQGFDRIVINTYFKPDSLKHGLRDMTTATVRYIDEPSPSGTAGALRKALGEGSPWADALDMRQPLLIVQGDAFSNVDLTALTAAHQRHHAAVTIGCMIKPDEDVNKFGIVATDHAGADGVSGRVQMFLEKPSLAVAGPHRLANTGFYLLAPETFGWIEAVYQRKLADARHEALAQGQEPPSEVLLDFALDIFPDLLQKSLAGTLCDAQGQPMAFWAEQVGGYWSDIGNPTQYVQTLRDVYDGNLDVPLPAQCQAYYDDATGVFYWPGAQARAVAESAQIKGNVVVALPFDQTLEAG